MRSTFLTCLVFLFSINFGCPTIIPIPPTKSDVVGSWIGFTSWANDFYRIVLNQQGGYIAHSFDNSKPELYKIDDWTINSKGQITFKTSPISNSSPIIVTGHAESSLTLQFMVGELGTDWTNEVSMYKETMIEKKLGDLKASMQDLK